MTPDEPSNAEIASTMTAEPVQMLAAPAFGMTLMQGRTLNKHVECDRSAINATLDAMNAERWALVGQPTFIGSSHVDMWFEKTVYEEEAPAAEPAAEPTAPADEAVEQ